MLTSNLPATVRVAIIGANGLIESICNVEPVVLASLPPNHVPYVPDHVDDLTHRWDTLRGAWVDLPPRPEAPHYWKNGEWKVYPPQPNIKAIYDYDLEIWNDTRTQDEKNIDFIAYKNDALLRITALRGRARLAYITDLPGQDMLYVAKAEEAKAFLVDPDPQNIDYPLILSEVGVTAPTAYEVAQVFGNLNMLWRSAAGSIDAACFQAEAAVLEAPDVKTIDGVLATLTAAIT